mgnify:CR=1 FL=1
MIISFLDIGPCRFRVRDSSHEDVISSSNPRFESSLGETVKIEQLESEEKPSRIKLILLSVLSFLITAVRALIIPTRTLYHKRAPLMYSCLLLIKKEYSESAIYYRKSETEANFMNFSKPSFDFGADFELVGEAFSADEKLIDFNRRHQTVNINTSYIFLYVLVFLFAIYGIIEINFTILFICLLSATTFVICHSVSLVRFKKALTLYMKDINYSVEHYTEETKKPMK